jgi:hypothetical protein
MPPETVPGCPVPHRNAPPGRSPLFAPVAPVTPKQSEVLALLVGGASFTQAAAVAGVDRATVYRWRKYDANFIASLNAAIRDIDEARRQNLKLLAGEATRTVGRLIRSRRTPVAVKARLCMQVIELVETDPTPPGPDDPNAIKAEIGKGLNPLSLTGRHNRDNVDYYNRYSKGLLDPEGSV